jgi:uncharacterized membrane protein YraQ (UPF0718 family)
MNVTLWIAQILLAVGFGMAGVVTSTMPEEKLQKNMGAAQISLGTVRFTAAAEIAGALGMILPPASGIATWLTPLAGVGLAVIMVLAAIMHARHKEWNTIVINVVLLIVAVLVAWGRFGPYSL